MFGFGSIELLVAGGVVVVGYLLWRLVSRAQWVSVDETHQVRLRPEGLEIPLTRLLAGLPASRLSTGATSTWTLSVQRAPWWTMVAAVPLFPIGVLLVFLVHERADLQVILRPVAGGGSEVVLVGTTRLAVAETLREALVALPRARPAATDAPADR